MDRRDFFKNASIASLGLIFASAVASVLIKEQSARRMYGIIVPKRRRSSQVQCGEGLWAYVQKNGVTKFYPPGTVDMNDILMGPSKYQAVYRTGKIGMEALNKALDRNQMTWLKLQVALENEKN